jgi:hypothetical protein
MLGWLDDAVECLRAIPMSIQIEHDIATAIGPLLCVKQDLLRASIADIAVEQRQPEDV